MARKLTINPTIPIEIQRSLRQLGQWAGADEGHITKLRDAAGLNQAQVQAQSQSQSQVQAPAQAQSQSVTSLLSSKISTLVNFRGSWSVSIAYVANDLVITGGNAYLNLKACTGVPVTNTAFWFAF